MTGWLTRLLEFCNGFPDDFVVDDPPHISFFLESLFSANIFRFGSHSCYLVSPSLVCLNYFEIVWLCYAGSWLEFSVLVEFVFLRRGLAQIFRACFNFFLCCVDPVPFLLLFSFSLSALSELDSCFEGRDVRCFFLWIT